MNNHSTTYNIFNSTHQVLKGFNTAINKVKDLIRLNKITVINESNIKMNKQIQTQAKMLVS